MEKKEAIRLLKQAAKTIEGIPLGILTSEHDEEINSLHLELTGIIEDEEEEDLL